MSIKLENTVKELIEQQKMKKGADSLHYQTDKQYKETYEEVFSLLRSGDRLARGSQYFAQVVEEERGMALPAYVLSRVERNFPHLRLTIERYKRECREELVEKLSYGKK
jgi:hypothetical protein